jgi:hypothetical protein
VALSSASAQTLSNSLSSRIIRKKGITFWEKSE